MKKDIKKIVAGILSASMLLGTSAMAFADNLSSGGTNSNPSSIEDFVSTDVFDVVVPTNATADTFKFILDPQRLITLTSGAAYTEKFVSGGTLYFKNTSGNANFTSEGGVGYDYSSKSDQLTVINKSTMDVDVTITASLSSAGSLQFTSDGTFTSSGDTAPKVYLALVNVEKGLGSAGAITTTAATDTTLLSGAEAGAYEFVHSGGHTYKYSLTSNADSNPAFSRMNFYVTGSANPYGDFTSAKTATPVLNVTWRVVPHSTTSNLSSGGTGNAGGSGSQQATQAYGYFDKNYTLWIAIDNNESNGGISDSAKLSNVKIGDTTNGKAPSAPAGYTVDATYKWLKLTWNDIKNQVTDASTFSYTITFTYDGTDYTKTVTQADVHN